MAQCRVCKNKFYMHGDICDDCLEDETIKETIQKLSAKHSVNVDQRVMLKAVEDEEKEYNELFNELNKNFTAYNWFITANPNSDEAKKRWDKIREIINRFSV